LDLTPPLAPGGSQIVGSDRSAVSLLDATSAGEGSPAFDAATDLTSAGLDNDPAPEE
jgi:hypothetical protein